MICEMHAVARLILTISRGDIRWFRFEAPDKRRPVLVLGREDVLPFLAQIPVIPLRDLAWEVRLSTIDGLPGDCVLKLNGSRQWNALRSARGSQHFPRLVGTR